MAGRANLVFSFLLFLILHYVDSSELTNLIDEDVLTTKGYVFWPNATIPFYVDKDHFDDEQSVTIITALAMFAFKTCLKFSPVMARPEETDHVLLLENPAGVRKCTINAEPHSIEEPHRVTLGYDCLKSPEIDMMIMKALGFPFEHNRAVRDLYIEVQPENVEPGFLDLFTRDLRLPLELRAIPYDHNSVMHFGQRDFSKNGHRTIIFKNSSVRQERSGLSPLDLRKIDVVYGPECRTRDRQEKIELCQNYPGVARRKRETPSDTQSLRVNPDITMPPGDTSDIVKATDNLTQSLTAYTDKIIKNLGIGKELDELVEKVNKIANLALQNAKLQSNDNKTKESLRTLVTSLAKPKTGVNDIIGDVVAYVNNLVATATRNLTEFCLEEKSMAEYQRSSCPFFNKDLCPKTYRSTKSGAVKYSTQHRPVNRQSTKPQALAKKHIYENWIRAGNNTEEPESSVTEAVNETVTEVVTEAVTTPVPPASESDAKQDLRSGRNTRLPNSNKSIYVPNYRSSNDTGGISNSSSQVKQERKKRETSKDTVVKVPAVKSKDLKVEAKVSKVKKHEKNVKSAKRRFESQRFRSQQGMYNREQREKEFDDSAVTAEKMTHNDEGQTNGHVSGKAKDMFKMPSSNTKQDSEEKRTRDDDKDPINDEEGNINDEEGNKYEGKEATYDAKKPKEEKELNDENKHPKDSDQALRHGGKRQKYDDKYANYDYKETKYEKKSRYEEKDPSYDIMHHIYDDKKTRFETKDTRYDDEDRSGNRDPRFDDKDPSDDEKRPRYKEKESANRGPDKDYHEERPMEKNRFKIRKPPQSKVSDEDRNAQMGQGLGSKISDDENDYQNQHGRDVKTKSKISAETNYQDYHGGVAADDEQDNQKRPRVSEEDDEKNIDMQDQDAETPKRPSHKKSKQRQKKSQHQNKPQAHLDDDRSQQTGALPRVLDLDKKNKEFYEERKWPDGVVRYVIKDPGDVDLADVRARLSEVNQILKRKTCARLEELTEEEADNYEDFLVLDNSPDYVTGRVGGRQVFGVVELLKGGQHRQHAAMMVMAMLGFYFEVSRHDRDKYIRVHMRHVRPDKLHHFEKIREDATFPLAYDYKSATHPAWQYWRQIGRTGISTVATFKKMDPDGKIMKSLGQNRQLLSEFDIVKINSVYGIKCFTKTPPKERQGESREERQGVEEEKERTEEETSNREDDEEN